MYDRRERKETNFKSEVVSDKGRLQTFFLLVNSSAIRDIKGSEFKSLTTKKRMVNWKDLSLK